jgi:hypothetical protein
MIYQHRPDDQDFTKIHRHSPALFYEEQIYVTNAKDSRHDRYIGVCYGIPVCEAQDAKTCMRELVTYIEHNKWWYPGDVLSIVPWIMGEEGNHAFTLRSSSNDATFIFQVRDIQSVAEIYNKIVDHMATSPRLKEKDRDRICGFQWDKIEVLSV